MYKLKDLEKYDYFKGINIDYALDSLTGVLSRQNILGFARDLVEKNIPFMMGILDIDNFKLVNDNYGHQVGDACLSQLAHNLAKYIGEDGLVGRFGGDEFIIICFGYLTYDEIHDYIGKMFNQGNVIRKRFRLENVGFYVTATIGCATFPKDALTYDNLFLTVDKALYRGKTKGRNCFIIYVKEKHADIEVHDREVTSLTNIFKQIDNFANNKCLDVDERIKNILEYVKQVLHISEAALLFSNKKVIIGGEGYNCNIDDDCLDLFDKLTANDNLFVPVGLSNFYKDKKISNFLNTKKIITFMTLKIKVESQILGYLVLFEDSITRIWQERESALLLYLSKVIVLLLKK